ncbi:MerR family transcriptional regulator [Bradyrhizobium sp. 18]|nr:MerR family transcriptional regulator [Bradyrhizobium sp. 18]
MEIESVTYVERLRSTHNAFPLISIQEMARTYDISVRQLRRWERAGVMPSRTKHGHRWKYQKADIAELMASREKERRSEPLPDPRSATIERRRALRRAQTCPHPPRTHARDNV